MDGWRKVYCEPFLAQALPTAPFMAFKNHHSTGALLSHKRRKFHSKPVQDTLQADRSVPFRLQRFNRPRCKTALTKVHQPAALRDFDRTCENRHCQVCPNLTHPNYVASTVHQTTHPVDTALTCRSQGFVSTTSPAKVAGSNMLVRPAGA